MEGVNINRNIVTIEMIPHYESGASGRFRPIRYVEYMVKEGGELVYSCKTTPDRWRKSRHPLREFERWLLDEQTKGGRDYKDILGQLLGNLSGVVLAKKRLIEVCRDTRCAGECPLSSSLQCLEAAYLYTHDYPHRCQLRMREVCAESAKSVSLQADALVAAGIL